MGTKVIELKYDDLLGEEVEAAATVLFTDFDGNPREIDLSAEHLLEYRGKIAEYVEHSRPANLRAAGGASARAPRNRANQGQNAKIRMWAKKQGLAVSERGRIAQEVVDKYYAAARRHTGPI